MRSYLPPGKFDELAKREKVKRVEPQVSCEKVSRSLYPDNYVWRITYTFYFWAYCQENGNYSIEGPSLCAGKEVRIFNCLYFAYEMTDFRSPEQVRVTQGAFQVIFHHDGIHIDRIDYRLQAEEYYRNFRTQTYDLQDTEIVLDDFEAYTNEEYMDIEICEGPEFYVDWEFKSCEPSPDYSMNFPLEGVMDECTCEFSLPDGGGSGGGGDEGTWNKSTHHVMIDEMAERLGLTKIDIDSLKIANDETDSFLRGNQFAKKAYLHAMNTDRDQSVEAARQDFEEHLLKIIAVR